MIENPKEPQSTQTIENNRRLTKRRAILAGVLIGIGGSACVIAGIGGILLLRNNLLLSDELEALKKTLTPDNPIGQVINLASATPTPFSMTAEGTVMITPTVDFPVSTLTPTETDFPTATNTPTATDTPTAIETPTNTATLTPTLTPTSTATNTVTPTETLRPESPLETGINLACDTLETQIVEIKRISEWFSEPSDPRDPQYDMNTLEAVLCAIGDSYRLKSSLNLPEGVLSVAIQPGLNTADGANGIFVWARENGLFFDPTLINPNITSTPVDLSVAATSVAGSSATPDTERFLGVDSTPYPTADFGTPTPVATRDSVLIVLPSSVETDGSISLGNITIPGEDILSTITITLDGNIEGASDAVYSLTLYLDNEGNIQMHWGLPRSNGRPQIQSTPTSEATFVDETTISIPGTATSAPIPGSTSTATSVPVPTGMITATQVPPPGAGNPTATSVGVPGS